MRKKVLLTGGLIALILILGSSTAFAEAHGPAKSARHAMHMDGSAWLATIATKLNLSAGDVTSIKSELSSGKSVQDVLSTHHITMDQIRSALGATLNSSHKLSNTKIAMIATKLGLDVNDVQNEIASGKTLPQILHDHHITEDQLKSIFGKIDQKKGKLSKVALSD